MGLGLKDIGKGIEIAAGVASIFSRPAKQEAERITQALETATLESEQGKQVNVTPIIEDLKRLPEIIDKQVHAALIQPSPTQPEPVVQEPEDKTLKDSKKMMAGLIGSGGVLIVAGIMGVIFPAHAVELIKEAFNTVMVLVGGGIVGQSVVDFQRMKR